MNDRTEKLITILLTLKVFAFRCGLAALCMASGLLMENGKSLQLKLVLEDAKSKGYTSQGEMFSAANMATLASSQVDGHVTLLEDGLRDRNVIVGHLLRGNPILIPYDADSNHEPCLRNGHKAHWAVLTGVVVCVSEEDLANLEPNVKLERDKELANLYHMVDDPPLDVFTSGQLSGDIYVFARQGKSLHVHIWSYASLSASNENLFEISPKRKDSGETYMVPAGGVYGGLCHRAVLLEPLRGARH